MSKLCKKHCEKHELYACTVCRNGDSDTAAGLNERVSIDTLFNALEIRPGNRQQAHAALVYCIQARIDDDRRNHIERTAKHGHTMENHEQKVRDAKARCWDADRALRNTQPGPESPRVCTEFAQALADLAVLEHGGQVT